MEIFRGFYARRQGEFVIESDNAPDNGKPYEHYRCHPKFVELIGWLRGKGVASNSALSWASVICSRTGGPFVPIDRAARYAP